MKRHRPDRFNVYRSPRVSDEAYLRFALRDEQHPTRYWCHPFIRACEELLGIAPTVGRAREWRQGRGEVLEVAWREWPKSKHLPALRRETPA